MSNYLFSYGTLQPRHAPKEVAAAVARLRPIAEGVVHGYLYDFGDYPGAVLDGASGHPIYGTVFLLPDDEGLLRELDEYEGFDPADRNGSLFVRELHPVRLAGGEELICWAYTYNQSPGTAPILAAGRYHGSPR